jgi:hypothetical protein
MGSERFFARGPPTGHPAPRRFLTGASRDFSNWRRHRAPRFGFARDLTLSRSPQNIGFAREHRAPRQRGRLQITIQGPVDKIGRQPGKMD